MGQFQIHARPLRLPVIPEGQASAQMAKDTVILLTKHKNLKKKIYTPGLLYDLLILFYICFLRISKVPKYIIFFQIFIQILCLC